MAVVTDNLLAQGLKSIQADIDAAFDSLLPVPEDPRARLFEAMRYAVIGGGKRVRPLLVAAVAEMYGVDRNAAVRVGAAIESVHVYSLIHDDLPCMDNDALRHGKPTLHLAFDEATAVLAGDALQCFAFELLADVATSGDPFVRVELVTTLATASGHNGMAGGQMMDIAAETASFDLATVTRLQQLKTGALLGAAVELGAILGKVPPEGRRHLRAYARDIGLAFQIVDDLLDHEGDAALAGKALRKDAEAGKETFVSLLGAERAREQARLLIDQAIAHLASHGPEADLLRALARFIVERDR
ncbi:MULTISPECIES: polyprenyl synthetase family protein [Novosphingobium]|uniref:Polyprenyl synthetase family protein n=1 Tax=Novosphingobium humi TaxID=2282397 RepID=A0ABY7TZS6_9SPHN|nr:MULTISPECIES: farnesyl diphosphate synthase [Novosphingobium]MBN9143443.1 polyprenyl synthetase family protein [Novosphingobium sp.]MDR6706692.1 farnesyl diphosphate synthase [Novosphingobium sp. 1748]NKI99366.1 farnesyl diphosphate synthase [Novosphingobium sp. SG707]ODU83777.1 MAG: farnesyl-diphosphate synthase [Novosphingobium sp. SCN 63-17]OJX92642.1 MAG: farnesyl-diphosphate synthase [Novosphingobium sp. 63-713]